MSGKTHSGQRNFTGKILVITVRTVSCQPDTIDQIDILLKSSLYPQWSALCKNAMSNPFICIQYKSMFFVL